MQTRLEDASATSRSHASWRLARAARIGAGLVAAFLLLLTLLDLPVSAYDIDHDLSSSASLEYFASRGMQFGSQVVQNVGPLGWVQYSTVYAGFLQSQKIALGLVRALVLAGFVLWACTRFHGRAARAAWLVACVAPIALYPIGEAAEIDFPLSEEWTYLGVYLAGLALLALPRGGDALRSAAVPLLALASLALVKHTLLVLSGFVVVAAALDRLRRRELGVAALLASTYAVFVVLIWRLAGQQLSHLPEYALGVMRFTAGYNEAMGLAADPVSTGLGFAVLGGLAAIVLVRTLRRSQSLAKSAIDAFFLFVVWKHGFVRGDPAHLAIFFHVAVFLALLFGLAWEQPRAATRSSWLGAPSAPVALASALLALLCCGALSATITDARWEPARLTALWTRNLAWIVSPAQRSAELSRQLGARKHQFHLTKMVQRVGRAPIDFFGYRPGWLLLNDLAYAPRPMPITFAATNEFLLRRNEEFYRDPRRAPRFVLAALGSIDSRLVPVDDALALGALLDNYHPVLSGVPRIVPATGSRAPQASPAGAAPEAKLDEAELLLLLERNPPDRFRERAERTPLASREIGFGEALPLEGFADRWLWLAVDLRSSPLGRLRSLLLRPASVEIVLEVEGRPQRLARRFVTSMGGTGFLVSPLVETSRDLFDAYATEEDARELDRVRSIRFECAPEDRASFEPRIATRLYAGNPPLLQRPARDGAPADPAGAGPASASSSGSLR